jgi:energy-converting hydrogenase Eha subunit G
MKALFSQQTRWLEELFLQGIGILFRLEQILTLAGSEKK